MGRRNASILSSASINTEGLTAKISRNHPGILHPNSEPGTMYTLALSIRSLKSFISPAVSLLGRYLLKSAQQKRAAFEGITGIDNLSSLVEIVVKAEESL